MLKNTIQYTNYYGPLTYKDHLEFNILSKLTQLGNCFEEEKSLHAPIQVRLMAHYMYPTAVGTLSNNQRYSQNNQNINHLAQLSLAKNTAETEYVLDDTENTLSYLNKYSGLSEKIYGLFSAIWCIIQFYCKKQQALDKNTQKDLYNILACLTNKDISSLKTHSYFKKHPFVLMNCKQYRFNFFTKILFKMLVSIHIKCLTVRHTQEDSIESVYQKLIKYMHNLQNISTVTNLPKRRTYYLKQYTIDVY